MSLSLIIIYLFLIKFNIFSFFFLVFPFFTFHPPPLVFSSNIILLLRFFFFSLFFKFSFRLSFSSYQLTSFISLSHNVPQHDEEINDKKDGGSCCERIDIIHWKVPSFQEDVWQVFHVIRPYEIIRKKKTILSWYLPERCAFFFDFNVAKTMGAAMRRQADAVTVMIITMMYEELISLDVNSVGGASPVTQANVPRHPICYSCNMIMCLRVSFNIRRYCFLVFLFFVLFLFNSLFSIFSFNSSIFSPSSFFPSFFSFYYSTTRHHIHQTISFFIFSFFPEAIIIRSTREAC